MGRYGPSWSYHFPKRPMRESRWQAETLRNVGNRIVRPIRVNGPDQMGTTIRDGSYVSARRGRRLDNRSSDFSCSPDIDQRERAAPSGACNNSLRQGLSADLADGHRPNNVLGGIPTIALDYSPAWDAQLFEWTKNAIEDGFRGQVREEFQILTFVQDGLITGPGGKPFGSSGFSINCPIVQRLD